MRHAGSDALVDPFRGHARQPLAQAHRDDPDWLAEQFFSHRDATTLDQIATHLRLPKWQLALPSDHA